MSSAREEILERIRAANANAGVGERDDASRGVARGTKSTLEGSHAEFAVEVATEPGDSSEDIVGLFAERVEDYKAVVERCADADVATRVAAAVAEAQGVLLPEGFPRDWSSSIPEDALRSDPWDASALDEIEAVVTTSAAGIARTGTIVLDHSAGQGRRALTLVPDLHVCVVRETDIYADVPQAVAGLRAAIDDGHALTWISGPSATSDIELSRVEGVHGPRRLHVIITD